MLIHMPVYTTPDTHDGKVSYMLELLLASLDSYFVHGNRCEIMVTTNDRRILAVLSGYRRRARHPITLLYVSEQDLSQAFGGVGWQLRNPLSLCYVLSKFYPVVRRYDRQLVHVDYDTLFLSRVDFSRLFVSDIGLVNANHFGLPHKWIPTAPMIDFFRMNSKQIQPVSSWINSGVFSIRGGGFELCTKEVECYLARLGRAIAAGYNDEAIMNALAVREPESVAVIRDYRLNFLAYTLGHEPDWQRTAKIVHFHSIKPHILGRSSGGVRDPSQTLGQHRVSDDFYLAALLWCAHLHAASHHVDTEFQMLRAMPLDVVQREQQRVSEKLAARRSTARGATMRGGSAPGARRFATSRKP